MSNSRLMAKRIFAIIFISTICFRFIFCDFKTTCNLTDDIRHSLNVDTALKMTETTWDDIWDLIGYNGALVPLDRIYDPHISYGVIWGEPVVTRLRSIVTRLIEIDRPFILKVPVGMEYSKLIAEVCGGYRDIQVIVSGTGLNHVYYAYSMDLEKDVLFIHPTDALRAKVLERYGHCPGLLL